MRLTMYRNVVNSTPSVSFWTLYNLPVLQRSRLMESMSPGERPRRVKGCDTTPPPTIFVFGMMSLSRQLKHQIKNKLGILIQCCCLKCSVLPLSSLTCKNHKKINIKNQTNKQTNKRPNAPQTNKQTTNNNKQQQQRQQQQQQQQQQKGFIEYIGFSCILGASLFWNSEECW